MDRRGHYLAAEEILGYLTQEQIDANPIGVGLLHGLLATAPEVGTAGEGEGFIDHKAELQMIESVTEDATRRGVTQAAADLRQRIDDVAMGRSKTQSYKEIVLDWLSVNGEGVNRNVRG